MLVRGFLALVGVLYAFLAIWCSVSPAVTSRTVGFELPGDSGRSEFLTVYGGLEMGLALVFLAGAWLPQYARASLAACLLIHGCLAAFRTAGFMLYPAVSASTVKLAAGEWVLLLAAAVVWRMGK